MTVDMLNAIMLNGIMLNVVKPNIIMLNVISLKVYKLNVVGTLKMLPRDQHTSLFSRSEHQ
jgi:hypothetical protein